MWVVIFTEWLQDQIQKRGLTYEDLGEMSGLSKSYISSVLSGKRHVTRNFCVSVAKGLGADQLYVLSMAGLISPPEPQDDNAQELLRITKGLPEEKKKTVLRFAKFISKETD